MEPIEASLKKNQLEGDLVFNAREGRMTRRDDVLPSKGKLRGELYIFLEGVDWVLEHMTGYRTTIPNVREAALKHAKKIYPHD